MNKPMEEDKELRAYIVKWLDINTDLETGGVEQAFADALANNLTRGMRVYTTNKIIEARQDELLKACYHWEKYPDLPATYLINRKAELKALNHRKDDV